MQTVRLNNRLPQVYRICKTTPVYYATQPTRTMSLFPRFVANEFAPMFRLLDDYAAHANAVSRGGNHAFGASIRSFQPRFDVKETKDGYELHGELPGIDQSNINIEFTDAHTLSIKGRTEHVREEGERPASITGSTNQAITSGVEAETVQATTEEQPTDADSTASYHKATVEDESAMFGANPDAASTTTAAESATPTPAETPQQSVVGTPRKADGPKYWVSERSIGEFARTFNFPTRVDQENVRASLKNGILSVVVPKAAAPVSRRINIE